MTGSRNTTPDLQIFYFEDVCLLVSSQLWRDSCWAPAFKRPSSQHRFSEMLLAHYCGKMGIGKQYLLIFFKKYIFKMLGSVKAFLNHIPLWIHHYWTNDSYESFFYESVKNWVFSQFVYLKKKIYISYENIQFKCIRISDNFVFICQTCNIYISLI